VADKPAPEEKKTPAAKPAEPKPAEPAAAKPAEPAAAKPAPAKPAEPAAAKPAPAKPAEAKPAKPAPAKPAEAKPAKPAEAASAGSVAAARTRTEPAAEGDDLSVEERDALRAEWADEAQRKTAEHDKKVRRFLLRLSLANWGIAIVAWTISAALGIESPASIIVYSVLFVIGLVAAILAILTYLAEKFGHEPQPLGAISADESDGGAGDGDAAAAKGDTAAPAAT
jgi:hypothetical protein